ncbi:unnamed protein product, partial [Discosporangium mesarthrocarpum]
MNCSHFGEKLNFYLIVPLSQGSLRSCQGLRSEIERPTSPRTAGSLLHLAAQRGDENMVVYLLSGETDVHARDENFATPLHLAAASGHTKTVRLLVSAGSDLHSRNISNFTPLHEAAWNGHAKTVRALESSLRAQEMDIDNVQALQHQKRYPLPPTCSHCPP